jgi:hypothetical protein
MRVIELLFNFSRPHAKALARPSTPKVFRTKEHTPTPYPSTDFTFGFPVESMQELGGASINKNIKFI